MKHYLVTMGGSGGGRGGGGNKGCQNTTFKSGWHWDIQIFTQLCRGSLLKGGKIWIYHHSIWHNMAFSSFIL